MHLLSLYQVYDRKAKAVLGPIWATPNEVPVARQLKEALKDEQSILTQNPEDFELIQLGVQDTETGKIEAFVEPATIFRLRDLTNNVS